MLCFGTLALWDVTACRILLTWPWSNLLSDIVPPSTGQWKSVTNPSEGVCAGGVAQKRLEVELRKRNAKIQGNDASNDTHLQSFQCRWECVAALEGLGIKYKEPNNSIIGFSLKREKNMKRKPSVFHSSAWVLTLIHGLPKIVKWKVHGATVEIYTFIDS